MHTSRLRLPFALTPLLLVAACGESTPPAGDGTGGTPPQGTGGATPGTGGTLGGTGGGVSGAGGVIATGGGATGGSGNASVGGTGGGASTGGSGSGGGGTVTLRTTCPWTPPTDPATFEDNWTAEEVTQFNANGGWTWYNDERVVVDAAAGKIVVGSAASNASSQSSSTNIDVVIHDLATGQNDKKSLGNLSYSDDHNNPGIVVKAAGEYFAAYTHHNATCDTHWANYGGGSWAATAAYTWSPCTPDPNGTNTVTYNNVWQLSAENGTIYNFIRATETNPWFLYSEDNGASWELGGRITGSPQVGYNAGYYKYWGNGVDRIDFFATEAHPRDSNTSVYHGYIMGRKSYDSLGQEIDADIYDSDAPQITEFTRVFQAGGTLGGVSLKRLWNFDITRYADGTVAVLWQGRENECADKNNCDPKHHMAYSRFDGTEWKSTRLVKGGRTLYRNKSDWWEEDYLGGAALDPDDPHVVYVSTNIDPRDEANDVQINEIWKGVTCDDGASFSWTPMTMNSANENLRPAVPKWDETNYVLAWFRGNYQTAQMYSAEVVGIIHKP
jgi:hypothetical protein